MMDLILPADIGSEIWDIDIDFSEPGHVIGYRIGRMIGEDSEDFEECYEVEELYIQYAINGIECSCPVSKIGESLFFTQDEADEAFKAVSVEYE